MGWHRAGRLRFAQQRHALLMAIVERQSAMRAEMRLMHGGQMPQMMERSCSIPISPSKPR
jgi:hypothetical protein